MDYLVLHFINLNEGLLDLIQMVFGKTSSYLSVLPILNFDAD